MLFDSAGATADCSASLTVTMSVAGEWPGKKAFVLSDRRSQCQTACCLTCTAPGKATSSLKASPAYPSVLHRMHRAEIKNTGGFAAPDMIHITCMRLDLQWDTEV